jgi:fimbrial chaperone protein
MYRKVLLIVTFSLMVAFSINAFTLTPMVVTIAPSGAQSIMTFKVTNDSDQQAAVAISVHTRIIDESGAEKNQPAGNLFLVFPSRVVLEPNSTQNIKVQYKGSSAITAESSFRVIAEQLPVAFDNPTGSGINILLRYIASLYVAPKNVKPNVLLASVVGAEKDGKLGLKVSLKNEGTKHALLFKSLLRIKQSTGSVLVELKGDPMSEFEGQNLLAMSKRVFFVPWEPAVVGATYEGVFSAEYE